VEIGGMPTVIDVGDKFSVPFTVTNTGQADATEVTATITVTPEGSARPAPGPNGYTFRPTDFGYLSDTIPGHATGEDNFIEGNIELVCKAACATTINIDVTGLDEYGWHEKQVSQSSGHFIVEGGVKYFEPLQEAYGNSNDPPSPTGWTYGLLVGETGGMIGPFSISSPFSYAITGDNGVVNGTIHYYGAVIPEVDRGHFNELTYILNMMTGEQWPWEPWEKDQWTMCCDLWDMTKGNSVTKDVLVYIGWLEFDSWSDWTAADMGWGEYCIMGGLYQILNGVITSTEISEYSGLEMPPVVLNLLGGTYNSTMAKDALRPIDPLFLEDAWWTVKQMMPAELGISKTVDKSIVEEGDEVTFTVTVTNNGPGDATNIVIGDLIGPYLVITDHTASAGQFDGDYWTHIQKIPAGGSETLTIMATVGAITGESGNYVEILASDQADWNPNNDSDIVYIYPPDAPPNYREIELDEGWNLMSLPVIPTNLMPATAANYDPDFVLGDIEDTVNETLGVWSRWDGAWTSASPDGFGSWTGDLSTGVPGTPQVQDGRGYWVNMDAPDTLTIVGPTLLDPPQPPPTYDLSVGWSTIGFKSLIPRTAGDYLAGIEGKYVIIYRFVDGVYSIVQADEDFMPGQGYWIALTDTGTIYP
jgi:uncharacterized repeat protein (TIGR01451 family)